MNILVCGFMGSGKTTFVEQFKNNSEGFQAFDLDQEIARSLNISSNDLGSYIVKQGISHFREIEIKILKNLLMTKTKKIISLGGGTIEACGFWELRDTAKMVFLNVSFSECFERIKSDLNRPLAQKPLQEVKDLYELRHPLYLKSDLVLSEGQIKGIDSIQTLMHNLISK